MMTPTSVEKSFRVTVAAPDVVAFRAAMARAGYVTQDTGERVTTDDGPEGEAVFVVKVPREACLTRAERVASLLVP